ncbi:MAG: nuclear transport factor 2 family protein [Caldilineaceae bacterium]
MQRCSWIVIFCVWLTASCVISPEQVKRQVTGSCSLELAFPVADKEAIRSVLMAEGELVVQQDIDALMALWSDGATITNAKNTPDNAADDQAWLDKDAIRHRYVRTVFPGAPAQALPRDLQIQLLNDRAVVTATTQIGTEVSPAGDRWVLVKQANCWKIQSLTYNLETQ